MRQKIFESFGGPGLFEQVRPEMEAACLANLAQVEDPDVRARLLPDHPWGCKRPLFSNDYYPAFNRPNLELVTDPIERITPTGIVTADGRERRLDTLILATGFATTKFLSAIDVIGRGGLSDRRRLERGAQAYKGVTTAGFPNLFMLYGPNTNSDSIITMIEYQADHVLRQIQRDRARGPRLDRREAGARWPRTTPRSSGRSRPSSCGRRAAPTTTARRAAASSPSGRARCRRWSARSRASTRSAYEAAADGRACRSPPPET